VSRLVPAPVRVIASSEQNFGQVRDNVAKTKKSINQRSDASRDASRDDSHLRGRQLLLLLILVSLDAVIVNRLEDLDSGEDPQDR
jgi:hypothetical protein